jgi:hypothetical protein
MSKIRIRRESRIRKVGSERTDRRTVILDRYEDLKKKYEELMGELDNGRYD